MSEKTPILQDHEVSRAALQSAQDVGKTVQSKLKPGHTISIRPTKTGIAMMVRFPRQKVAEQPNAIETDTKI